jgi:hypothetical protein
MTDAQHLHDTQETPIVPADPVREHTASDASGSSSSTEPDTVTAPLSALIASIRTAVISGASPDARAAGAIACRSILTVLEAKPGQPLAAAPPSASTPSSPVGALLSQPGFLSKLAAMSREQLLDLLKQATGSLQPRSTTQAGAAPRFHLIEIPRARRPGGG